jgi:chromosome segregation ATPase
MQTFEEFNQSLSDNISKEEALGRRLMELSKNASKNAPKIKKVMEELRNVSATVDDGQATLRTAVQDVKQEKIAALQGQQNALAGQLQRMSKQPSKYAQEIADIGRQTKAIDKQIDAVQNG